jgi:hypothetical protein
MSEDAEVLAIKALVVELLSLWPSFTAAKRYKSEKAEVGARVDEERSRQRREGVRESENKAAHEVPMRRLKRRQEVGGRRGVAREAKLSSGKCCCEWIGM